MIREPSTPPTPQSPSSPTSLVRKPVSNAVLAIVATLMILLVGALIFKVWSSKTTDPAPDPQSTLFPEASVVPFETPTPPPTVEPTATPTPTPTPTATGSPTEASAKAYYDNKQYSEAAQVYLTLATSATDPTKKADYYNSRGNALREANLKNEAVAAYKLAVTANPKLIVAYLNASSILKVQDKLDEARELLDQGLAANPGNEQLKNARDALDIPVSGAGD